jgi:RNA polymerase sigma factor (sigma-70 family)
VKGVDVDHDTEGDDELVRRTVGGDQRALSALFDRHAATVTRYAWALAATRMDVEEIVQDTFVTLWKKVDQIDLPEDSLLPWLLVVCRNHAANLRRKQARAATDELPDDLVAPDDGEGSMPSARPRRPADRRALPDRGAPLRRGRRPGRPEHRRRHPTRVAHPIATEEEGGDER